MTVYYSIIVSKIPWAEKPTGYKGLDMNEHTHKLVISLYALNICLPFNCFIPQFSCQSCPTLGDPMDYSTQGFPVHHQLLEVAQTHVHRVGDAIQPSHPLSSPFSPAFSLPSTRVFF